MVSNYILRMIVNLYLLYKCKFSWSNHELGITVLPIACSSKMMEYLYKSIVTCGKYLLALFLFYIKCPQP